VDSFTKFMSIKPARFEMILLSPFFYELFSTTPFSLERPSLLPSVARTVWPIHSRLIQLKDSCIGRKRLIESTILIMRLCSLGEWSRHFVGLRMGTKTTGGCPSAILNVGIA
jgi:hypothetical protein